MSTSPSEPSVAGLYFDGRSARAHPVVLSLQGGALSMSGTDLRRVEALDSLRLSEPMGDAPRWITFSDGAHVEVRDHARLAQLLAAGGGRRDSAPVRWAFEPRAVAAALVMLLLIAWFGWRDGLPWAARHVAGSIPTAAVDLLSGQALHLLDARALAPSAVDEERRRRLEDGLRALARFEGTTLPHRLLFRAAPGIGANAFALPDGTLVVTDELVELAAVDDEVLAVLAHELGHVHERHGLRLLLQGSALALVMTWYLGDVSAWLAAAPVALVQASYSREMEYEADDFALRLLRGQGLPSEPLAVMLEKLQAAHADAGKRDAAGTWLDSHPQTAARIARLREQGRH